MKILWTALRDPLNPTGGAETSIREIGRRLVSHGHTVVTFTGNHNRQNSSEEVDGIRVVRSGDTLMPHLLCRRAERKYGPFDVIIEDLAHVLPWFPRWATETPRTVFFHHLHRRTLDGQVPPLASQALKLIEKSYSWFYRGIPFVVESNQSLEDLRFLGVPSESITRILPGLDFPSFRPGPKSDDPFFLYFGGMRYYKRPEHAIQAFSLVADRVPKSRLVVVGSGPALSVTKQAATRLGLLGRVDFTGTISNSQLKDILARSWVNIHCSVAEGFGFSILEAAAAAVPTVAYSVPGVSELLVDGFNGRLVPDGNVAELADSLTTLTSGAREYGFRAREWASRYSWDDCAVSWIRHLEHVAAAG